MHVTCTCPVLPGWGTVMKRSSTCIAVPKIALVAQVAYAADTGGAKNGARALHVHNQHLPPQVRHRSKALIELRQCAEFHVASSKDP